MKLIHTLTNGWISFWCPGCGNAHSVPTKPTTENGWEFDGNITCPTITPSLRVFNIDGETTACHVVVTKGVLNYCGDSAHSLKGKAIPMVEF